MKNFTGICLITRDVLRLAAFYRDALGAETHGDATHTEVFTQGTGLAIFSEEGMERLAPDSMQGTGSGRMTLEFQVEAVDDEYERMVGMGVQVVKPPTTYPWGRRAAWFRDPDGNIVNFYQVVK